MSKLEEFAKRELENAGLFDKDSDYNGYLGKSVLKLIKTFASQGHSGFSAERTIHLFSKVARYEPLLPLTGEDNEWFECIDGLLQNKRCYRVFKDKDGKAWDSEGKIFVEPDGASYVSLDSRVYITFPYIPKSEYVKVEKNINN